MTEKIKTLIVGSAIGAVVGIAAGYGVAKLAEGRGLRGEGKPADVKSAWDAYVVAQKITWQR